MPASTGVLSAITALGPANGDDVQPQSTDLDETVVEIPNGLPPCAADAEVVYRKDLDRFPENGWSLFGLWQSLAAQQQHEEARLVRARFDRAWARADVTLTSSRILLAQAPAR